MKITNKIIALVVVVITLFIPVASYFFSQSREDQQRACEKRCSPKWGAMRRDPQFDKAFKKNWDGGPVTCQCMDVPSK
jgi:hypothetical protein